MELNDHLSTGDAATWQLCILKYDIIEMYIYHYDNSPTPVKVEKTVGAACEHADIELNHQVMLSGR